jgi:5'-nucleotidase
MDDLDILVTNDDGIDSLGIHALYESLSEIGSVTAVVPADDQSAVGRSVSQAVSVREHDLGYVIDGTPVDCVVAGLSSLYPEADLVVAGVNQGANMGAAVLGRSGTVSAAVEAAFLGVPGIAVSLYIPTPDWEKDSEIPQESYGPAVDAATYLANRAFDAGLFEVADYLNINAPAAEVCNGEMEITRPSHVYELSSKQDGDQINLVNPIWEKLAHGDISDPEGTDRRAIVENKISVSPLTAPHSAERTDAIEDLAAEFSAR